MLTPTELLIGLLERDGAVAAAEDLDGEVAPVLRACLEAGFLGRWPLGHPAPSCPHCREGVPRRVGRRLLCTRCRSEVDAERLRCRAFDRGAFLAWLAGRLGLRGGPRRVEDRLWHLGTWDDRGTPHACFYLGAGTVSAAAQARIDAHRNTVLIGGSTAPATRHASGTRRVTLAELLRTDGGLDVARLDAALGGDRHTVTFDERQGVLRAGGAALGEVPVGSREYHFLRCLAANLGRFVPYADLKHEVCARTGSADTAGEAAFCHAVKRRIKRRWIPGIDALIATTNKGDGYRLRAEAPGGVAAEGNAAARS